jgi:prevent-host-death family protein
MEKTMNLAEAKSRFSEVIERVIAGQSVTIVRNGKPVAEIRPLRKPSAKETVAQIRAIRERVAACQDRQTPTDAPRKPLRDLAHEGHRY